MSEEDRQNIIEVNKDQITTRKIITTKKRTTNKKHEKTPKETGKLRKLVHYRGIYLKAWNCNTNKNNF